MDIERFVIFQDGPRKIPVSKALTGVFLLYSQNNEIYKIRNGAGY